MKKFQRNGGSFDGWSFHGWISTVGGGERNPQNDFQVGFGGFQPSELYRNHAIFLGFEPQKNGREF
jgi:hypothetical protein